MCCYVFFEEITKWLNDGSPVYLDFHKAFDKVPHPRLMHVLKSHGMGNSRPTGNDSKEYNIMKKKSDYTSE